MNKNILLIVLSINLFMGSLFASPINDIDEEPWLRTWIFVGPFDEYEWHKRYQIHCMEVSFEKIKEYSSKNGLEDYNFIKFFYWVNMLFINISQDLMKSL